MSYTPPAQPVAPNGQPLADFGNRLLAYLIDYALYLGVTMILMCPFMIWWMSYFMNVANEQMHQSEPQFDFLALYLPMFGIMAAIMVLGMLFTYLYNVEYQLRSGQTLGKKVMKLKVIPLDPAATLTRGHLVKRWAVAWVAGGFVPFFHYLDGFWQLWDKPWQQCLHDKAATTVVVRVG